MRAQPSRTIAPWIGLVGVASGMAGVLLLLLGSWLGYFLEAVALFAVVAVAVVLARTPCTTHSVSGEQSPTANQATPSWTT